MVRGRPLVLCYHAVSSRWRNALSIDPDRFERHLRLLLRLGYRPATAEQALVGHGRLLHVTFDDAYTSLLAAVSVLERLGVPSTVFVCTSYARDGRPLDVPELADDLRARPEELETMTWSSLRDLVDRGVEVGSHTVSHPHLPELGDEGLASELVASRNEISDVLGVPCRLFAYPYGAQDPRVRAAARAAGYHAAFGLPGDMSWSDRYNLPRTGIWRGESLRRTALKTSSVARTPAAVRFVRGRI